MSAVQISRDVVLEPADNNRLANLCGQFDEHLRQIERRLNVEIASRGNRFRITGRPGLALVTSGPGATNTVTGIASAVEPIEMATFPPPPGFSVDDFQSARIAPNLRPLKEGVVTVTSGEDAAVETA